MGAGGILLVGHQGFRANFVKDSLLYGVKYRYRML